MTGARTDTVELDGRRARRDRNRLTVLDCVLEMFYDDLLIPTIDDVARRSGISLRSVYRYFDGADDLIEQAIERNLEAAAELAHIPTIGRGPFGIRCHNFVTIRVDLYEHLGAGFRATVHNAPHNLRLRESLLETRRLLRDQFELQFAPELDQLDFSERDCVVAAGDVLTQFDSIDVLRRARLLTVAQTEAVLERAVASQLRQPIPASRSSR